MTARVITIVVFAVLFAGLEILDLIARYSKLNVPTLSQVLRWAMRRRSAQIGIVMAWWWIGWHFIFD